MSIPNPLTKRKATREFNAYELKENYDDLKEDYDDLKKTFDDELQLYNSESSNAKESIGKLYENLAAQQNNLVKQTFYTVEKQKPDIKRGRYDYESYNAKDQMTLQEIRDLWVYFFYDLKTVKELNIILSDKSNKMLNVILDDVGSLDTALLLMDDFFPGYKHYYFSHTKLGSSRIANYGFHLKAPLGRDTGGEYNTPVVKNEPYEIIYSTLYKKYGIDAETNFKTREGGGRATMKQRRKKRSGKVRSKRKPMKTNKKYRRLRN